MHFKSGFGDVQIIAGEQRAQGGIMVNALDGVIAIRIHVIGGQNKVDVVVFAHEPLQERRIQ